MILSMTGFGRAEGTLNDRIYQIEIRAVNSRFLEFNLKYPRFLETYDLDFKNLIRKKINRGKISMTITVSDSSDDNGFPLLDTEKLKHYTKVLKQLRKQIGSKEIIKLEHILKFEDIFEVEQKEEANDDEIKFIFSIIENAIDDLFLMKRKEGDFLRHDILSRIESIKSESEIIFKLYQENLKSQKDKLIEKVNSIISDPSKIDERRVEFEIAMLSEKYDITEENIRLGSHLEYFVDYVNSTELSGRRLNFLLQEMNREINTIASKSNHALISQKVSFLKEELEKIREQIQNIE